MKYNVVPLKRCVNTIHYVGVYVAVSRRATTTLPSAFIVSAHARTLTSLLSKPIWNRVKFNRIRNRSNTNKLRFFS